MIVTASVPSRLVLIKNAICLSVCLSLYLSFSVCLSVCLSIDSLSHSLSRSATVAQCGTGSTQEGGKTSRWVKKYWLGRTACADPGIFTRGGGGSRPDCQKTALTTFFSPQLVKYSGLSMVYFKENYNFPRFQRGSNIFQGGPTFSRGIQLFPGGSKC